MLHQLTVIAPFRTCQNLPPWTVAAHALIAPRMHYPCSYEEGLLTSLFYNTTTERHLAWGTGAAQVLERYQTARARRGREADVARSAGSRLIVAEDVRAAAALDRELVAVVIPRDLPTAALFSPVPLPPTFGLGPRQIMGVLPRSLVDWVEANYLAQLQADATEFGLPVVNTLAAALDLSIRVAEHRCSLGFVPAWVRLAQPLSA